MKKAFTLSLCFTAFLFGQAFAQEPSVGDRAAEVAAQAKQRTAEVAEAAKQRAAEIAAAAKERAAEMTDSARAKAGEIGDQVREKADEVSDQLRTKADEFEQSEQAQEASGTVIAWIQSAEALYKPWMNWFLVAIGIGIFISHAGQLVLGKIWALCRGKGCNFGEVINDLLVTVFAGLALPVVLLIPVGHGAFISSPLAVLSAAGVGMILGVILYSHGMKQEMLAAQEKMDQEAAEG